MDFPHPVSFHMSQGTTISIIVCSVIALVAIIAAVALVCKDNVKHRVRKGILVGVIGVIALGTVSTQWALTEHSYLQAEQKAQKEFKDVFLQSGAVPLFDKADVRTGHTDKFKISYQGQTANCESHAESAKKPIKVDCR